MKEYDIITFGSATRDNFLFLKRLDVAKTKRFIAGKAYCFPAGAKIEVEKFIFSTGGGGANTASTFANQGFRVAYCGMVGGDIGGKLIIEELQKNGVETPIVKVSKEKQTDYSFIITAPIVDRTILVHHGASGSFAFKDMPLSEVKKASWWYLAPLSGKLCRDTEKLVKFAKRQGIKVAINPGSCQLSRPKMIKRILNMVDVVILNQEEASLLTKVPYSKETEVFRVLDKLVNGITIMTKGPNGVVVSDGRYLYYANSSTVKVVDRTGAGDAFASGFVSGFIRRGSVPYSIQLGIANAVSCIRTVGAREGLLKKDQKWQRVRVKKTPCYYC
ncbi:MAG: carbohydrate kinase family protein [Candidatus Nealsonbacteria bacterium]|nr:carbohydrate kinase family protein [Candidatus Nealsonbacteria bacterium]